MNCPHCQQELPDDSRFCTACGHQLSSTEARSSSTDPLLGQLLDRKYELVSRLGEGGMGTVYRARRVHIGDEVAVKVLHTRYVTQKQAIERFKREARAAAQLRHQNVVVIYDYGEAPDVGVPGYIVMELVEGLSLGDVLKKEGALTPERTIALMKQVCAGVAAAHKRNIIHRDLKPDNIVVLPADGMDGAETVKVVDFGLAKLRDMLDADTLTATGTIMGTPYYMSPEQCQGYDLDPRSDVYSLGAILYEMLVGQRPFTGPSAAAIIVQHLTAEPPSLPVQFDHLPALRAVFKRALSKNATDRQEDAAEFARELGAAPPNQFANVVAAPLPTAPAVQQSARNSTDTSLPIPTLTHVGAAVHHTPNQSLPPQRKRRSGVIALGVIMILLLVGAGAAGVFLFTRDKGRIAKTKQQNNSSAQRANQNSSEPTGGTLENTSTTSVASSSHLVQQILGRWRNKTGKLEIEFKEGPTGIEGVVLRVPEGWPKNRVKVGDVIFTKGKIVGDTVQGLYINLPQYTDCPNIETRYSRCEISFESNDNLRVTNSAWKYSFPQCTWSTVAYDDTWNWFRI